MYRSQFLLRPTSIVAVGVFSLTSGACGYLFSHGPPQGHEQMQHFSCTESNAGPIIDVIWAGLNVVSAVSVASDPDSYEWQGYDPNLLLASSLIWAVVSGSAAPVGFNKSKKCRAAKLQLAQRQAQGQQPVTIPPAPDAVVQAVVVSPAADTLMTIGAQVQLIASAINSSGAAIGNKAFTWSSSNDAIASVNNAGLVTGHANGAVVIAANTDNVVGIARIVVNAPEP